MREAGELLEAGGTTWVVVKSIRVNDGEIRTHITICKTEEDQEEEAPPADPQISESAQA